MLYSNYNDISINITIRYIYIYIYIVEYLVCWESIIIDNSWYIYVRHNSMAEMIIIRISKDNLNVMIVC